MSQTTRFFSGTVFATILLFGVGALSPQVAQAASLTSAQINAIIGLLQSFGADQSTINNVQAALGGTTGGGTQAWCHTFNTNLKIGDFDKYDIGDVYALHQALINEGFNFPGKPTLGGQRSYDEETASVVVQFQAKYGIRQTGYVGPITRAKLNSLYGCGTITPPKPQSSITSLQPTSGLVGTSVTITGSGFTATNNSVKFGGGYLNGISSNGTAVTFTVPDGLTPCPPGGTVCAQSFMQVTPGVYSVSVINANGTSNIVNFAVPVLWY